MRYRTPSPQFTTLIANNIRYWQETVTQPDHLQKEQQNVYQSIDMGLQVAATMPTATDLLLELSPFIEAHGYWRAWIPLLEKSIAAHADTAKRWDLQIQLAFFLSKSGESETAVSLLNNLLTKPLDTTQQGRVHYHLGSSYFWQQQYDEARSHTRNALAIFTNHPEVAIGGTAPALNLLGVIHLRTGDYAAAIPLFIEAREKWQQRTQYDYVLTTFLNEGLARSSSGQTEAAMACYQEAMPLLKTHGNLLNKARILLNLGSLYASQEKWNEAEATYLLADRNALYQQGHLNLYAQFITSLGYVVMEMGELKTAVSHTTEAIAIWQQLGDGLMEANALENLGDTHHHLGDIPSACTSYQNGINLARKHPNDLFAQQLQQILADKLNTLSKGGNGARDG